MERRDPKPLLPKDIFSVFAKGFEGEDLERKLRREAEAVRRYHLTPIEPGGNPIARLKRLESEVIAEIPELAFPAVRLGVLVFGRPTNKLVRDSIDPATNYLDRRSGRHIDIVRVGYRDVDTYYDSDFVEVVEFFESKTKWRYSGRTDVLLFNLSYEKGVVRADLNTVCLTLEDALDDKLFSSVEIFFEKLISFSSSFNGDDPAWGFSDSLAATHGKSVLIEMLLTFVPKGIQPVYKALRHVAVKDISI